jgi:hypothetical protein
MPLARNAMYAWGTQIYVAPTWELPVMVGDQLQGVLGRGDVISLLRTTAEFSRR